MRQFSWKLPLLVVVAYGVFIAGAKSLSGSPLRTEGIEGSVVLPPHLQTILYMGDRYLAANVESMRVLATGGDLTGMHSDYYHRLHQVVSLLNPCHEDNYYVANALLAWAGGVDAALRILREATDCRFWDEVPPFFLGYNLYFFKRDHATAKAMLFAAADRSTENRVGFQRIGIMFETEAFPDVHAARNYLKLQHEQAREPKLRDMLSQRIARLDGLIALDEAQEAFERRTGRTLQDPNDLLRVDILKQFPSDPMRLGYEFKDGRFALKELKVRGMEERPK
jgi:hypothetical protein